MAGSHTYEELKELGTVQAGAIQGKKKTLLPEERRAELKEFYNWHKK